MEETVLEKSDETKVLTNGNGHAKTDISPEPLKEGTCDGHKRRCTTWMVGGVAGAGINSTGELFGRCFTRGGLNVFAYLEYPSLIRGGHNSYHIRVSPAQIYSQIREIDLLLCLNRETFDLHHDDISATGGIVFDPEDFDIAEDEVKKGVSWFPVPFGKIVKENEGMDVMRNMVALGASLALLSYPLNYLNDLIAHQFGKKGEKVVELNKKMAKAGYEYMKSHFDPDKFPHQVKPTEEEARMLMTGNQAFSYGAMAAGCKFFAAYPMTPASSTLSVFAKHDQELGMVIRQTEDELSAVLHTIGASYAGVRAMTATSGGGFALMNEAISMAGIAEVPLVLLEVQRPGPGTGMPTWTSQGDLQYVLNAGHDEFPKIVMAPGDVKEAYRMIQHAFNYAEQYHLPVMIVSDKYLSESLYSVDDFGEKIEIDRGPLAAEGNKFEEQDFPRYQVTDSGVSPRTLPGMKTGRYVSNSYEHNEFGDLEERPEMRNAQHSKRLRKLDEILEEMPPVNVYGPDEAVLSVVAWGSTKAPVLEAMRRLARQGIAINLLHPTFLHPFPADEVRSFLKRANKTLLIEGNHNAQLGQLIRQESLVDIPDTFLKWDGRPFYPDEIVSKIKSLL
jgi:2-oxoglutarate/2-oxoacid ferredoxin oxidoreductase subunit alpha